MSAKNTTCFTDTRMICCNSCLARNCEAGCIGSCCISKVRNLERLCSTLPAAQSPAGLNTVADNTCVHKPRKVGWYWLLCVAVNGPMHAHSFVCFAKGMFMQAGQPGVLPGFLLNYAERCSLFFSICKSCTSAGSHTCLKRLEQPFTKLQLLVTLHVLAACVNVSSANCPLIHVTQANTPSTHHH